MTVSYADSFWKLLLRWRGSLWKTIWKDLLGFLVIYYAIRFGYKYAMTADQKDIFEKLVQTFNSLTEHVPLTFMLGFYVGMVVKRWYCLANMCFRWWDQFQRVSWPDNFLYWVSAYIRGTDHESRLRRRTIARYSILSSVLGWRNISVRVLKRFPTLQHVVDCGLMTEGEKAIYERVCVKFDPHRQWFVPLNWILSLLVRCYEEQRLCHVNELAQLHGELQRYRAGFVELFVYDWITIPLVYTQVAVVATYGYFGLCLIGRQFIDPSKGIKGYEVDTYFPVFTVLQFLFYVGWLKVGEDLMNPFGEDDEDFELNYLIDRNMEMVYMIADTLHGQLPSLKEPDAPLGIANLSLPHTKASSQITEKHPSCHLRHTNLSAKEMHIVTTPERAPINGIFP